MHGMCPTRAPYLALGCSEFCVYYPMLSRELEIIVTSHKNLTDILRFTIWRLWYYQWSCSQSCALFWVWWSLSCLVFSRVSSNYCTDTERVGVPVDRPMIELSYHRAITRVFALLVNVGHRRFFQKTCGKYLFSPTMISDHVWRLACHDMPPHVRKCRSSRLRVCDARKFTTLVYTSLRRLHRTTCCMNWWKILYRWQILDRGPWTMVDCIYCIVSRNLLYSHFTEKSSTV